MRTLQIVSILLTFSLIYISCTKSEKFPTSDVNSKLIQILTMKGDAQRSAFNLLTAEEKLAIRTLHINQSIEKFGLQGSAKELAEQLITVNKSEFYETLQSNDDREYANTVFEEQWREKAKEYFSDDQIYTLAYSLNSPEEDARYRKEFAQQLPNLVIAPSAVDPDRSPTNNESLPDCFCNVGSSFTCPKFTITYDSGDEKVVTSVGYNPCSYISASACDVEGGCGFMGWSTCDGNKC